MKIISSEFVKSSSTYSECPEADRHEYAFIGRSNVGKSSLINMLTGRKALAKISGSPGKTQLINHFLINKEWYLVDLPGYGYAKVSKVQRKVFSGMIRDYILKRPNLVNVYVLLDSRLEPQKIDLEFMNWLGQKQVPFTIVFTKADKLSSSNLNKNLVHYKKKMLESWEVLPRIFVTSSTTRLGGEELLNQIDELIKDVDLE